MPDIIIVRQDGDTYRGWHIDTEGLEEKRTYKRGAFRINKATFHNVYSMFWRGIFNDYGMSFVPNNPSTWPKPKPVQKEYQYTSKGVYLLDPGYCEERIINKEER